MSTPYVRNNWLPRLGTGLNIWQDTITSTNFEFVNTPTSVTQAGTPFNAEWMNNLETGVTNNNTEKASLSGDTMTGTLKFNDNVQADFGTDNDASIVFDGTVFRIKAGTDSIIAATPDAAVDLRYDNNIKLATTATGINVTGSLDATGAITSTLGIGTDAHLRAGNSIVQFGPTGTNDNITFSETNNFFQFNADGSVNNSILNFGGNYLRFNNGVLEQSSDFINWEVVGVQRFSKFNIISNILTPVITTTPVSIASFTGKGVITRIIITNIENDNIIISYSIDGAASIDITRPTAENKANLAVGKLVTGTSNTRNGYDLFTNIYFNTSFDIMIRSPSGSQTPDPETVVMFNHE